VGIRETPLIYAKSRLSQRYKLLPVATNSGKVNLVGGALQ